MADQFHFHPDRYLELVRAEVADYDLLQDLAAREVIDSAPRTVLDLGTGTGETLVRVARSAPGARLVGIDASAGMLAHARRLLPQATLRVQDLADELPAGSFDVVVSALAVHHLTDEGKADLFARVAAQLSPGGRFVLGDVVIPDDPAEAVIPLDEGYDRPSPVATIVELLEGAAFPTVRLVWSRQDLALLVAATAPPR
ncbi:MAG: class I SAM-dependent methyltransferase [Acidimicrobiales bacterium]